MLIQCEACRTEPVYTYTILGFKTGPVHHQQPDHFEPIYPHSIVHGCVSILDWHKKGFDIMHGTIKKHNPAHLTCSQNTGDPLKQYWPEWFVTASNICDYSIHYSVLSWRAAYPVFGIDVGSTVDKVLCTFVVTSPHGDMKSSASQLGERSKFKGSQIQRNMHGRSQRLATDASDGFFFLDAHTLSLELILPPSLSRISRAGRLPPRQAQWTAVASS